MFAHRLATFCLLTLSLSVPMAAASTGGTVPISLRLRTGTLRPAAFEEMQKELTSLMSAAGVAAQWVDPASYRDVDGSTVVVDFEGECDAPFHADTTPPEEGTPIGSTATAENRLLPFVHVSCNGIGALMAPFLADQPEAFREFIFGRALGRVLAHELYHIVTQSENHLDSGVAKARFSAADLMKSRFEFNDTALERIRVSQSSESPAAALDSSNSDGLGDAIADGK